ncbi:hypothetical protein QBC41DRAFT_300746 [Cercophora samala]|uniref:Uncharacterized protein n=1 Tax=Cercophora samala TaxID=330535 RepID=A0AA39ZHT4_9PEZI|nr:hypothetical protein QBC41DRAFT_300746 [Cercophora samala]
MAVWRLKLKVDDNGNTKRVQSGSFGFHQRGAELSARVHRRVTGWNYHQRVAMGVQLEPISQSSFEQYGPWHFRDSRFQPNERVDLGAALLRAAALPALNDLRELSARVSKPEGRFLELTEKATSSRSSPVIITPSTPVAVNKSDGDVDISSPPGPCLALDRFGYHPVKGATFTFTPSTLPVRPRPNLKRRRPDSDVDGYNTASMSCKKRRLLRHLVTSRLSAPFSLPATHILNREVVASGDKRFLKLAAIMAARKLQSQPPPPPQVSPDSFLRRQAIFNRCRLRMATEGMARGGGGSSGPDTQARHPASQHASFALMRALHPSTGESASVMPSVSPQPSACAPAKPVVTPSSPPSRSPPLGPTASGASPTRLRIPSPRLRPLRSPELRGTPPALPLDDIEDLDDDGVAFPTSVHESRYGDEPDEVYADFGLIFGVGGEGDESDEEGPVEQFEDYMDDLDGIPWNARC